MRLSEFDHMVVWIVYPACGHGTKTHCEGTGWVMQVVPVAFGHVVRWAVPGRWEADCVAASVLGCVVALGGGRCFTLLASLRFVRPFIHASIHL
jgi:hypothetical protein